MVKKLFISYRSTSTVNGALAIYQALKLQGYDVFLMAEGLVPLEFEQERFHQIAARPYFLAMISPGTLVGTHDPYDCIVPEIEEAIRLKRFIIPVYVNDFIIEHLDKYLSEETAAQLKALDSINLVYGELESAITNLQQLLNKSTTVTVELNDTKQDAFANLQKTRLDTHPPIQNKDLEIEQLLHQANNEITVRNYEHALVILDKVLGLKPNYAIAYSHRGFVYAMLDNYEQAITDLTQAIVLEPKDRDAFTNRATMYSELKQYKQAIQDYTQAITLKPDSLMLLGRRGAAYYNAGKYDQALEDFNNLLESNLDTPTNNKARIHRGDIYNALKQYDQAIKDFSQILQTEPYHIITLTRRGTVYGQIEQHQLAIDDFNHIIELKNHIIEKLLTDQTLEVSDIVDIGLEDLTTRSEYASLFLIRGTMYYHLKHYGRAFLNFDQTIELDANNFNAYRMRALANSDLKKYDQAIQDYNQALNLKSDVITLYRRGNVHVQLKQYNLAIQDYKQILAIKPNENQARKFIWLTRRRQLKQKIRQLWQV